MSEPGAMRETAEMIEAEAARWVWRLDREPSEALRAEHSAWLAGDTRRQGAWLRAEAAWAMLERGSQLAEAPAPAPRSGVPRRAMFGPAGGLIAASIAGAVWWRGRSDRFTTLQGEIRRVPLSDGSVASINTSSVIEVAMTARERRVRLDRGEAWFEVAKNPERPFVVDAGPLRVRAVGTAFSVRRIGYATQVLVTEGVVEALLDGRSMGRLGAGSRAMIGDDAQALELQRTSPDEVARQLAWRTGQIDLAGQPLSAAAAEFNRYNARKIVVSNPALAGERLYGVFRIDDPEGFAKSLTVSLRANVTLDPQEIRVE